MDLEARKLELIRYLTFTKSESIIKSIENIIKGSNPDFWEELPKDVQLAIEEGLSQADKGQTIPHSEMTDKYSKWL